MKVVSTSPPAEVIGATALKIEALATATITSTTPTIFLGTEAKLTLTFTGLSPYSYTLSDGKKGDVSQSPTDITVKPEKTTTYTVQSVSNVCGVGTATGSVEIKVEIPLGVNLSESQNEVLPYPNPTDNLIRLNLSSLKKTASPVSLELFDVKGTSIWQKESRENLQEFDATTLKSGVYILRIKAGNYQSTHKIVKQ